MFAIAKFTAFFMIFSLTVLSSKCELNAQEFDNDQWVKYCRKLLEENSIPGLAGLRKCIWDHRTIEFSTLKSKICNKSYCLYKLKYSRKIYKGRNDWYTYVYEGSGYKFYYLDDIETTLVRHTDGEHGARLIDGNGQQTIVAQCAGSSCGGFYEYDHGPHRGAELRGGYGGPNYEDQYWVLKLPQ